MKSSRLFLSILCGCILAVPNVLGAPTEVAYCSNSVESEKAVSKSAINVKSEIAPLKKVLLHRPGKELLNLTPDTLERLLFDDIPFLKIAQKEHDEFAKVLKDNGVEVVYLEDLAADTISVSDEIREKFIRQFIEEIGADEEVKTSLYKFLSNIKDSKELILKTMEGIRLEDVMSVSDSLPEKLASMDKSTLLADPMPNLYFTRDNFASVGNGITLNKMFSVTRNRETIYAQYIFNYHPEYKGTTKYYNRNEQYHIEGGDILNLNEETIAVGISQRTEKEAIEKFAKYIFSDPKSEVKNIVAFYIPHNRAMMHLDTVFTQVDKDKFTIHPEIRKGLKIFEISKDDNKSKNAIDRDFTAKESFDSLENILKKYLKLDAVTLIPCGGDDSIAGQREQWNDGSNTLCIAPGVVVVYDRNEVTNEILEGYGIKVLKISSSELSRGRGGPRCMSMPLSRKN